MPDSSKQQKMRPFDVIQSQMGVFEGIEDDHDHDHDLCKMIATKATTLSEFPVECRQFKDCVSLLKRHTSAKNPYSGMSPGDAIDAMRAKDEGHLNSAQIKRRMTSGKNGRCY